MEPFTTGAIISILTYLGDKAFDKAFDTAAGEFTKGSIDWLKSIFFNEDDKPKDVLKKFQENPESQARQNIAKATIELELEENPEAEKYLLELAKVIEAKSGNSNTISNSKNVNTGNISSGGNTIIGDNNN